jgi:hypothetical protein
MVWAATAVLGYYGGLESGTGGVHTAQEPSKEKTEVEGNTINNSIQRQGQRW